MRLTIAAQAIRPALQTALASVSSVLDVLDADISTIAANLRLVTMDGAVAWLLAAVTARLTHSAPGVTLAVLPW